MNVVKKSKYWTWKIEKPDRRESINCQGEPTEEPSQKLLLK